MRNVISCGLNGQISMLHDDEITGALLPGQPRHIERVSEIKYDTGSQLWYIEVVSGPYAGIPFEELMSLVIRTFIFGTEKERELVKPCIDYIEKCRETSMSGERDKAEDTTTITKRKTALPIFFKKYRDAVLMEVLVFGALRLTGNLPD